MHYAHDMPCASAYLWESAFTAFKKKKKNSQKIRNKMENDKKFSGQKKRQVELISKFEEKRNAFKRRN